MLDNKNNTNNGERNLSDVFRELQEAQFEQRVNQYNTKKSFFKAKQPKVKKAKVSYSHHNFNPFNIDIKGLKLSNILAFCVVILVATAVLFPKNASFKESYAREEVPEEALSEFELNRHRLNMQSIISENANMDKVKEQVIEERDIEFETTYNNNGSLPKDEQVITQEGVLGKENVTAVKTYENGEFVEETILNKDKLLDPVAKLVDIGTSEFLAKNKVHIGDTMYFKSTDNLKESADSNSKDVAEAKASLDVKLLELPSEEWCKVSFDNVEGFIKTSSLTSAYSTPSIVEKNRVQRILIKVNIDMELNKPSGLTLTDYKKIFTGLSSDTNKIFENNYDVFYNIEKKYNINGIFLASMAIHESGWGTSQIANDKKNLFGYGSYDSTPYESSYEFDDYKDGIELVAKSLVKYYLNPSGTKIYDGETASAWYFNGPTLSGVNTRYASDKEWHTKVFNYMQTLYNRLN